MGVTGLCDIIGNGEVWPLAAYAARHFEQHKRPLRIAVDEACWRFTNLTPEQVQKIREGEPAANPVEKVILWRILRLLRLNVQLLFVNDGPKRPWKRNKRGGGLLDRTLLELTRKLFRQLKVPYHEAPGEAEAECARLQALGVVDAVWSDDGDALMFGCTTLIRQHKTGNERVKDHIRVYNAAALREKYDLDADGLVLFAVPAGGDYDTAGLKGCGPSTAHRLARSNVGLSQALRNRSERDLPLWHDDPIPYRTSSTTGFSYVEGAQFDRNPTVSIPDRLFDLRGLRHGWDIPIKQPELRIFLRERFHFTTREFLKHIAPIFVARRLARAHADQQAGNVEMGIELKRTRKKKDTEDDVDEKTEAKITFSPLSVVDIDLSLCPPEEDWTKFASKDGTPYDPTQNVDVEILRCFLAHGLPDGALEYAKPAKRKRKAEEEQSPAQSSPSKKRRTDEGDLACHRLSPPKKRKSTSTAQEVQRAVEQAAGSSEKSSALPKKRGRPKKQQLASPAPDAAKKSRSKNDTGKEAPASPPIPVFRQSHALLDLRASIVDRYDDEDSVEGEDSISRPIAKGDPSLMKPQARSPSPVFDSPTRPGVSGNHKRDSPTHRLIPGEAISPKALRELRTAAFLRKRSSETALGEPVKTSKSLPGPSNLGEPVVIDLT